MNKLYSLFLFLMYFQVSFAQKTDINTIYTSAIANYDTKNYQKSVVEFTKVIELANGIEKLPNHALLMGANIFTKNNDEKQTFRILNYLANERLYSETEKIIQQPFNVWKNKKEFQQILSKITHNKKTLPARNRILIQNKLLEAKALLKADNGKLWGHQIWNDSLLVIDFEKNIYSLVKIPNVKSDNDTLYYKVMEDNTLVFVNTTQKYKGKEYATVLFNYLHDNSSTIIHELFHLLHHKFKKLNGNSIDYLDETTARILLRLEYKALTNTLTAIHKSTPEEVKKYLKDAVLFRKKRQQLYSQYLNDELELETLEGLANYTGFKLSSYKNKTKKAIREINEREQAKTYTRPFAYATGPAYGLIFDYFKINWKNGLDKIYNFANIYENKILNSKLHVTEKYFNQAKLRNNFLSIHKEERKREEEQKKLVEYYTELLINKPTLKVPITDFNKYTKTYNMNGTIVLKEKGIVYSSIKGKDRSNGKNFGDFFIHKQKDTLGNAGILSYEKGGSNYFVFPLPIEVNERKIIGEFYTIQLNPNWKLIKTKNGNIEIIKK